MLTKSLYLEIDKPNYVPIYTVQYDYNSRFYEITILNNSQPLDLTGIRVIVAGKKPDGKEVFNSCKVLDAKKGLIQLELTEQMNAVNGASEYALELFSADGMLSSQPFKLIVTRSTISKSVESSKELGALKDALNEVQDIDNRFAQTNAQLSQIKRDKASKEEVEIERQRINSFTTLEEGSTTGDAEILDARIGANAMRYKNLGEAIRNQYSNLKNNIENTLNGAIERHIDYNDFELGDFYINSSNQIVFQNSSERVRTKHPIYLEKGDVVKLNVDYKFYRFIVTKVTGEKDVEGVPNWLTCDYVCPETGYYAMLLRNSPQVELPNVNSLLDLMTIEINNPLLDVLNYNNTIMSYDNQIINFSEKNGYEQGNNTFGTGSKGEKYTSFIKVYKNDVLTIKLSYLENRTAWIAVSKYTSDMSYIKRDVVYNVKTKDMIFDVELEENVCFVIISYRSYDESKIKIERNKYNPRKMYNEYYDTLMSPFYACCTPSKPRLINHRGYETKAPENSIPAFKLAGEYGAFSVECDINETKDGKIVVIHNDTVDALTNGTGKVSSMTLEEIRELRIDAGANVTSFESSELVVPTLEEYLRICKKYGMVAVIEVKEVVCLSSFVDTMLDTIYSYGMQHSCIILTYSKNLIQYIRCKDKMIQISKFVKKIEEIDEYKKYKNFGVTIDKTTDNIESIVRYAQLNKMLVNICTSNDKQEDAEIAKLLPDFITTRTTNMISE